VTPALPPPNGDGPGPRVRSPARGVPMRPAVGPDGVWLRTNRLGRRLTRADLAERAGVSKEAVHTNERGRKHPHGSTLALLARALGAAPPRKTGPLAHAQPRRRGRLPSAPASR
jgi:DNA-binding XRE family transcriptional regulator